MSELPHEMTKPEPAALPADFEVFFAQNKAAFLRTAGLRLRDRRDAEDALMDAAVAMFKKWERILAHANPMALANRILNDTITDFYRRRTKLTHREQIRSEVPDAAYVMELGSHERLDSAFEELERTAPQQAACVRLRHLVDLPYEDVAQRLDISVGAAKTNVSLGMKKLCILMGLTDDTGEGDS
ncbi:sigma-70 family RNA polymerase sigma factor [Streptomyces sp. NPDC057426]|uniref:sigma-70 family RNA polymerase sigma factor n=1 Tax=Streptomyces sp. NPDC057426 TaxID=3346128 RepID=UPI0036A42D93